MARNRIARMFLTILLLSVEAVASHDGVDLKKFSFSADLFVWDEAQQLATFKDNVILHQEGVGRLTSDKEVQVQQNRSGEAQQVEWIKSSGMTQMSFLDPEGEQHHLVCHELLHLDTSKMIITLDSPIESGAVPAEKQIFFHNSQGKIYADKATVTLKVVDGKQLPNKLTIEGNVKLVNSSKQSADQSNDGLQYGLADIVVYDPQTKALDMLARAERRVLLYDHVNQVQMSAPAIHITRDAKTLKQTYEGVGDVRFTFSDLELRKLKETFASIAPEAKPIAEKP